MNKIDELKEIINQLENYLNLELGLASESQNKYVAARYIPPIKKLIEEIEMPLRGRKIANKKCGHQFIITKYGTLGVNSHETFALEFYCPLCKVTYSRRSVGREFGAYIRFTEWNEDKEAL